MADVLTHRRATLPATIAATALAVAWLVSACSAGPPAPPAGAPAGRHEVRILGGAPGTLDPAATSDAGSSAVIAQLFETLTAIDPSLSVRPALAERWDTSEDGRHITFVLRPDLRFSDESPLDSDDVVRSWLRIIDPESPSPLASLMYNVTGAREYATGEGDRDDVGLRADGPTRVEVDLDSSAAEFASIVASPTFSVVPVDLQDLATCRPGSFVGSGAYTLADVTNTELRLERNAQYWAGAAPVPVIRLIDDIGGQSPVTAFEAEAVDHTPISSFDASWIRFDPDLGPRLREVPSLSTEYLGFDTTRPPFDDTRVRQAFAHAVNWTRLVELAGGLSLEPATSMVPNGMPGRSERNFIPKHDPEAARALLADAGFPGGRGFPQVTFMTGGSTVDGGFIADIKRELGITIRLEIMDFDPYFDRLETEPPQIWSLSWIADYPGPNDFLGVLLGSDSTNNYGGWSNEEFDAAIRDAGDATDPQAAREAYDRAEEIVQREAPVVPIANGTGWALSRDGLLGATENGLGSIRYAGLSWR